MPNLTLELLDKAVFLIIGLLALTACLAGGRLLRLWLALAGLQAGLYLGLTYGSLVFSSSVHQLVLAIVAGILLAGFFSILSRIGALFAGGGVLILLADLALRVLPFTTDSIRLYILGGAFLAGAILGLIKFRGFLILASAFNGGWLLSFCAAGVLADWLIDDTATEYAALQGSGLTLMLISTGVLLIIGSIIQFKLTFRRSDDQKAKNNKGRANADRHPADVAPLVLPGESPSDDMALKLPERPPENSPENHLEDVSIPQSEESVKPGN